jgi:hypothetical protein
MVALDATTQTLLETGWVVGSLPDHGELCDELQLNDIRLARNPVNAFFVQVPQAFAGAAPASQARAVQRCDVLKSSP